MLVHYICFTHHSVGRFELPQSMELTKNWAILRYVVKYPYLDWDDDSLVRSAISCYEWFWHSEWCELVLGTGFYRGKGEKGREYVRILKVAFDRLKYRSSYIDNLDWLFTKFFQ